VRLWDSSDLCGDSAPDQAPAAARSPASQASDSTALGERPLSCTGHKAA
jgi:hypothetical protein